MAVQYDSARSRYIRGALTNGREWIFVLLELNSDQKGGKYWRSDIPRKVKQSYESDELAKDVTVKESDVDVIVAILADWVRSDVTLLHGACIDIRFRLPAARRI